MKKIRNFKSYLLNHETKILTMKVKEEFVELFVTEIMNLRKWLKH